MVHVFTVFSKFQLLLGPLFPRGHLVRLLVFTDVMMSCVAQVILLTYRKTETHSPFRKVHCFSFIYIQLSSLPQSFLWNICYMLFLLTRHCFPMLYPLCLCCLQLSAISLLAALLSLLLGQCVLLPLAQRAIWGQYPDWLQMAHCPALNTPDVASLSIP